jgi:toxin FitB
MRAVADTSVIISALLASGPDHDECAEALRTTNAAAAGHAWVESFSVLTRLPVDVRLTGAQARFVLGATVPNSIFLSPAQQQDFADWLPGSNVVGGAVYDALIGWAAHNADLPLLTRDRRALSTYRTVGVEVLLIGSPERNA